MDIYEVVRKLVGPTTPVGSTEIDAERFQNLETLTELVELLLIDISVIAVESKGRDEYSMKRAGRFAEKFMDRVSIESAKTGEA